MVFVLTFAVDGGSGHAQYVDERSPGQYIANLVSVLSQSGPATQTQQSTTLIIVWSIQQILDKSSEWVCICSNEG